MEQAVKVFVLPTNDSSSFLESVSTESNGHAEIICEKDADDHDDGEDYDEILKDSTGIELKTTFLRRQKPPGRKNFLEYGNGTKSTSAPLANIARTLHVARSWLNRSRASSAKRTPRVDSCLEKLEMAGPSHVTHNNNHELDTAYSTRIVEPSGTFRYYWLTVVTVCVLYNWVFIIARTAFTDLQNRSVVLWLILDYICDLIYVVDMVIQFNTGKCLL